MENREKLKAAFAFGGILSPADIEQITLLFQYRALKPDDYFQDFNKVVHEITFVQSGAMRIYSLDENGNEVTKCFIRENQFFADLWSYQSAQPSTDAIQSIVASELYTIPLAVFEKQYGKIPNLFIFSKAISELTLLNGIKDNDFLNFGDAKTKYLEFLKRYPQLAQQLPQQYVASYLKITPQSLSRIRKDLSKNKK